MYAPTAVALCQRLRILLRDVEAPHVFTDEELREYLDIALWKWNHYPPETMGLTTVDIFLDRKPQWQAPLLWGAVEIATRAVLPGLKDRVQVMEHLKENASNQWDKLTEAKRQPSLLRVKTDAKLFGRKP